MGGVAKSGSGGGSQADASAWLAVMAGTIGALMATLDISIVNAALPTIQGEVGASGSEGTWIATAYLVAEIIAIPLTGWLERIFGLRLLLVIANVAFVGFSVLGGISTTLQMLIVARVGQGFFGGMLIPTAMTIIATRLPPDKQPIGTAMFGATAVLGPVLGPLVGGWLTEAYTWHYTFFINVPIGVLSLVLLMIGLPAGKTRFALLRQADWLGIAGLALGLGGLTVVLEDGQRELWFDSPMIRNLTIVSVVGFVLLFLGQVLSEKPVIKLALLLDRSFAAVFAGALAVGAILMLLVGMFAPASFLSHFIVFVLSVFIGFQVIWNVSHSLHTPLMAITNAISSIIIVGALIAAASAGSPAAKWLGLLAVVLALSGCGSDGDPAASVVGALSVASGRAATAVTVQGLGEHLRVA